MCYFCQGQRFVRIAGALVPCAECGGTGELNCCEGLQAQPDPQPTEPSERAEAATQ